MKTIRGQIHNQGPIMRLLYGKKLDLGGDFHEAK